MPNSPDMIVRVAHADVAMHMAFQRSVAHWHGKDFGEVHWKMLASECAPILIGQNGGVVIDGNCSSGVSAPDGGLIHIYGDFASTIDVDGFYEIVIAGDVRADATIVASGFCHVFVGHHFSGELRSSGSAKIWIGSDFNGTIKTGNPSTEIYVGRDYNGDVGPNERTSLLWLTVGGFASQASLSRIVDCGYTQFNATIARSDVAPGIYPQNGHRKKTSGGNSFNRWCVETESKA